MKALIAVLLSTVFALGLTPGTSVALANGDDHEHEADEFEVTFSSNPRFPVAGEEAELTFKVSHDGTHEEGLMVIVALAKVEEENHHHGEEPEEEHEHEEVESAEVTAIETAPGVYVAKYTFEDGGKYQVTAYLAEEHAEFVVAVRSSPVAWPFVIGLAGVSVLLAGVVAVIKTVRKEW